MGLENELEPQRDIPHALAYFPNTAKLLEQLGSNHLSLDESSKQAFESIASEKDLRRVISAQNKDGQTLAHLASRYKCNLLWGELVRSGIDLNIKDKNGCTALEYQTLGPSATRGARLR
jgi:ankyrin repeat protein